MPKISQLPTLTNITTGSIIPVVENAQTQKISVRTLFEFLSGALDQTFATEVELLHSASRITSSFETFTASVDLRLDNLETPTLSLSASQITALGFVTTGSNTFTQSQTISAGNSLLVNRIENTTGGNIEIAATGLLSLSGDGGGVTTNDNFEANPGGNATFKVISGSVIVTGSIRATGTPIVSSSQQITDFGFATTSSVLNIDTSSLVTTSSFNTFTSSLNSTFATDLEVSVVSGAIATTTGILQNSFTTTSSFNSYTASINSLTSSLVSKTGSYASTGSNIFNGNQTISGSLNVSLGITGSTNFDTIVNKPTLLSGSEQVLGGSGVYSSSAQINGNIYSAGSSITIQDLLIGAGTTFGKVTTDGSKYISVMPTYNVESARFWANGNVTIQTGGDYVDNGYRLEVSGSTKIVGDTTITGSLNVSGSTSISGGLAITNNGYSWNFNSDGTTYFPNTTIDAGTNKIDIKSSDYVELWYSAVDWQNNPEWNQTAYLYVQNDGVSIQNVRGVDGNGGVTWNNSWKFNNIGGLEFPDSTVQTTAFIPIQYATTGSNTFTGSQTITGSNGRLVYTGTTSGVYPINSLALAEVHTHDDTPWLEKFYNDTFSSSSASMAYFGWNDGRFVFHNESTQSIGLQVNGFGGENGLLVYSDKVAFVNNVEVSGSLNVSGSINGANNLVTTSSFNTFSSSVNSFTASVIATGSLTNTFTSSVNTSTSSLNTSTASLNAFSASVRASGSIINTFTSSVNTTTSSLNTFSASVNTATASLNSKTGSYATTGSNQFKSDQVITGSLTVTSLATISSSISANSSSIYLSSGSNLYIQNNGYFELSGSALVSGSLNLTGSITINSGSITMPDRPAFKVKGNGGALRATASPGLILSGSILQTPDFNQGNHFNPTTGIFTAPIAGLYQVNLVVRTENNTNNTINQFIVYKSGSATAGNVSEIMIEYGLNTSMNHVGGSTITKLAVGDTLKAALVVGSGSFDGNNNFSVAYIG